ncbi:MAG: phosphate transport system permease protein [Actinomycetota bacterium]|jgi:phosphate transport system permease protein|nr:phosphate transport system permease protein [Actinomycetota bacterium]HQZ85200.1 phosphate ABC transporter permease PstA [Actinomycetota bacterium]
MSVDLGTRPVAPQQGNPLTVKTLPRFAAIYAAIVGVAVALLLNVLTSVQGVAGTAVVAALVFAAGQTVWSFMVEGRRHAVDRLATTLVYAAFLAALVALIAILAVTVVKGIDALNVEFLQRSMRNVSPQKQGGGIYHALIGTIEQVLIAALIAVPAGILTAIYLVEYGGRGRLGKAISFFVDVMTGIPSIIAGLFIYTFWVLTLGFQRSGFAGALALVILMIPVVVRSTEEMLKIVPNELREASYALGIPKWKTILRIVLPTAIGGIITGVMLAVARVAGETAPLLLTTFLSQSINYDAFSGPQASLPTFVWDQISSGTGASLSRAWAGALVLIVFVMILYLGARIVAKFFAPKSE